MPNLPENFAPYAPANNIIDIIKHFRDRGLPEVLTQKEFSRLNIPDGNIGRVTQTLRFLGLIDEDGRRTATFSELGKASTEQYTAVLANIVRDAYHVLLTYVDPVVDDEMKIMDQFRHFEPQSVRTRMVALFMALCREAKIIESSNDSNSLFSVPRKPSTSGSMSVRSHKRKSAGSSVEPIDSPPIERQVRSPVAQNDWSDSRYHLLHGLIKELPESGTWTKEEHTRWAGAMTALTNYLVREIEPIIDEYEEEEEI